MASSFFSFEFLGSSLKPSRLVTHLCRSVNRTVIGSTSGNLSARAIAMSSVDVQVNGLFIVDFLDAFIFQRLCNCGIHDQLCQMHCCLTESFNSFANCLMSAGSHDLPKILAGGTDLGFLLV